MGFFRSKKRKAAEEILENVLREYPDLAKKFGETPGLKKELLKQLEQDIDFFRRHPDKVAEFIAREILQEIFRESPDLAKKIREIPGFKEELLEQLVRDIDFFRDHPEKAAEFIASGTPDAGTAQA